VPIETTFDTTKEDYDFLVGLSTGNNDQSECVVSSEVKNASAITVTDSILIDFPNKKFLIQ
jgi:hypothetical protein